MYKQEKKKKTSNIWGDCEDLFIKQQIVCHIKTKSMNYVYSKVNICEICELFDKSQKAIFLNQYYIVFKK